MGIAASGGLWDRAAGETVNEGGEAGRRWLCLERCCKGWPVSPPGQAGGETAGEG